MSSSSSSDEAEKSSEGEECFFSMPVAKKKAPPKQEAAPSEETSARLAVLPEGWAQHWNAKHQAHYYCNEASGQTTWEKPAATKPTAAVTVNPYLALASEGAIPEIEVGEEEEEECLYAPIVDQSQEAGGEEATAEALRQQYDRFVLTQLFLAERKLSSMCVAPGELVCSYFCTSVFNYSGDVAEDWSVQAQIASNPKYVEWLQAQVQHSGC